MRLSTLSPSPCRTLLAACLVLAALPAAAAEPAGEIERRAAEAQREIEELLATQAAAWSRGDLETFTSIYAEDATFLSPSGLTRGRQEVLERYRRRYPDKAAMGELTLKIIEARPAAGRETTRRGRAVPSRVHGMSIAARWTLRYPPGAEREEATGLTLIVFRRIGNGGGDGWKIVQDASM